MCTNRDKVQIYDTKWKKLHLRDHITCFHLYDILERQNSSDENQIARKLLWRKRGSNWKKTWGNFFSEMEPFYILIVAVIM